jgi:hypothetical protein
LLQTQELFDKVGEGRAYWSLGNAYSAMGCHKEAFHFAQKHLESSRETGDTLGQVWKTNFQQKLSFKKPFRLSSFHCCFIPI